MTGVAFFDIDSFQLEEGVVATEYERPAPAPDYPIEVKSLNDFDVVSSVGKRNLFQQSNYSHHSNSGYSTSWTSAVVEIEPNTTYTVSYTVTESNRFGVWQDTLSNGMDARMTDEISLIGYRNTSKGGKILETVTTNSLGGYLVIYISNAGGNIKEPHLQVVKGAANDELIPAPEDIAEDENHPTINKINILLDEPLRSVGNTKDRLFRDSDGIWKIERNVEWLNVDNSNVAFYPSYHSENYYSFALRLVAPHTTNIVSSHLPRVPSVWGREQSGIYTSAYGTWLQIPKSFVGSVSELKTKGIEIQYESKTPTIEILSQSLQDKLNNLRSFQDSNYVYTVINDKTDIISENLKPTLHATFKGGGWYSRWKAERLEIDVSNKADRSDVEEGFSDVNESIDEFRRNYESYQDSAAQSMEDASNELQKALERTSIIEANLGEGAADWIFTHTQIRMSDEGVTIGQKEAGSYLQISDNQISFFNGSEEPVAFINGGMLHINHAIFVESIQISEFMISSEISGHITFRYVGGS